MNLSNKDHPKFEPEKWNSDEFIKKTHNCYSYALNIIYKENAHICKKYIEMREDGDCSFIKPQLGRHSGYLDEYKLVKLTCDKVVRRLKHDNPHIKKLRKNQECPDGYYKIALTCRSDGFDYHFYRQDSNGLWSHKNGWRKATNKDSDGRLIKDPKLANRGDFDVFCGYFMVPNSYKYKNMSNKTKKYKDIRPASEIISEMINFTTK